MKVITKKLIIYMKIKLIKINKLMAIKNNNLMTETASFLMMNFICLNIKKTFKNNIVSQMMSQNKIYQFF